MGLEAESQLKEIAWMKEQERLGLRPRSGSIVSRRLSSASRSVASLTDSSLLSYNNASLPRNVRASKLTLRRYSKANLENHTSSPRLTK